MTLIKLGADNRSLYIWDYENNSPSAWDYSQHEAHLILPGVDGMSAVLSTGTYIGFVYVDYYAGSAPRVLNESEWESVEQITILTPPEHLYITSPSGIGEEESGDLITAPGPVTIRAAVRGRINMLAVEFGPMPGDSQEPSEYWQIDAWPA